MTARFTFLELMLVMCLTSVVLALSAPRLADLYRDRRLVESARQLVLVHNGARDLAVNTGVACRLNLEPDWRTIRVAKLVSPAAAPVAFEAVEGRLGRYTLPPGIQLARVLQNGQELNPGVVVAWEVEPWGGRDELRFELCDTTGALQQVEVAAGASLARVSP